MPTLTQLAIRELAEFVHRQGDLYQPGGRVTAEEGISGQSRWQQAQPAGYQREHGVSAEVRGTQLHFTLRGRVDGVDLSEGLVEEIKTTRRLPDAPASEHLAQGRLYAAILAREHVDRTEWTVRLTYVHPDNSEVRQFSERLTPPALEAFLQSTVDEYERWVIPRQAARQRRDQWLQTLTFPLPELRPYQRAMIRRCADALEAGEHLLLEAPTGSGKTLSVTYPAVKALPASSRIFYLTSRNTGAAAALTALGQIAGRDGELRRISLTARERICPVPGTPCDPEVCSFARGYYDRRLDALKALLTGHELTAPVVSAVALTHNVCPFELSLDAALWCDVIIGDYNYLFDPLVRLQRFAGDRSLILLIDEAHQLSPRVADSLSIALSRSEIRAAIAEAPAAIASRLRGVDRQLMAIARSRVADADETVAVAPPDALVRSLERLLETSALWYNEALPALSPPVNSVVFAAARWVRLLPWMGQCAYAYLAEGRGQGFAIAARCLDPAPYLKTLLHGFGPHIRFSATVSPPDIYQRLHGSVPVKAASDQAAVTFARAGSPFASSQIGAYIVPDIGTRYRQRAEGLVGLVALVREVLLAQRGRYLICFPSYQYLSAFAREFDSPGTVPPDWVFCAQQSGDSDDRRQSLLDTLQSERASDSGLLLGIVLGGVFAESIDLAKSPLAGVLVIGVAIPPPSPERELAASHFSADGFDGRLLAYIQPGMSRIVQAAGRLIRSHQHRGVLVLVDARYQRAEYRQFFPALWKTRTVAATQLGAAVKEFWNPE